LDRIPQADFAQGLLGSLAMRLTLEVGDGEAFDAAIHSKYESIGAPPVAEIFGVEEPSS